jgi:hypothetical protein
MVASPFPTSVRDFSDFKSSESTLAAVYRHTLLQQQVGRLEQGTGHEAPLHGVVPQQIDQRQQAYPLMVRHEGSDSSARFVRRQARRCVIHRLVETVVTCTPFIRQSLQVFTG